MNLDKNMKRAKIKLLEKKPSVRIAPDWLPHKEDVDQKEFDRLCRYIERLIDARGMNNVRVYYGYSDGDVMVKIKENVSFFVINERYEILSYKPNP